MTYLLRIYKGSLKLKKCTVGQVYNYKLDRFAALYKKLLPRLLM